MSKTFFDMMDGVLEEYASARMKQIPGVDMAHYFKTLKLELSMNVQKWFIKHVEAIADNKSELKTVILRAGEEPKGVNMPKPKTGVEL